MDGDVIDAEGQVECIDIDECTDETHECSPNALCENKPVTWCLILSCSINYSLETIDYILRCVGI